MKSNNIISYLKLVMCILFVIASAGLMACSNIHNNGSKSSSNDLKPLIIGSDNYVPYSYLDSDGNFTGIDVEIAMGCRHDVELIAVDEGKEGEFFPIQKFFDDHARTRISELIVQQHLVSCFYRLLHGLCHDHPLTQR